MKRLLAFIIVITMILSLSACENSDNSESEPVNEPVQADKNQKSDEVVVDEGLLDVTITLPASMFADEEEFDPESYNEEQGYKKTVVNEDGSVSITMSKSKHNEIMNQMKTGIDEAFAELVDDENTPYIKKITYEKGFSTVTVEVDKEGYESAVMDMTPFFIGFSVMIYQQFDGVEPSCEIVIKDISTGDILNSTLYPDTLNN